MILKAVTEVPPAPSRPDDGHKGTFGTVIVVGGQKTMIGAPALCASAAFAGGAGLVKIAAFESVLPFCLTIEPGATGLAVDDDAGRTLAMFDETDGQERAVLAVGPGMGSAKVWASLIDAILRSGRAVVLDADGLNHLAAGGKPRPVGEGCVPEGRLILTPHPGEFARLAEPLGISESPTDPDKRPIAAARLARAHAAVVVLKGQHTIVTDGSRFYRNQTGNAALATAGTGDVLTGLVSSLVAQGLKPFDAAVLAAHVHGLAADLWCEKNGPSGLTARKLINHLPLAMHRHRSQNRPHA